MTNPLPQGRKQSRKSLNMNVRDGAGKIKHLPYNHGVVCSDQQIPSTLPWKELDTIVHICTSGTVREEPCSPGSSLTIQASLIVELPHSVRNNISKLKFKIAKGVIWDRALPSTHMGMHTYTLTWTHTAQIHMYKQWFYSQKFSSFSIIENHSANLSYQHIPLSLLLN